MTGRQQQPKPDKTTASIALLLTCAWFAAPVMAAAPAHETLCDKTHRATLNVNQSELTATRVSHDAEDVTSPTDVDALAADHILKSSVKATVREVFPDSDAEPESADVAEPSADDAVLMNTRVPGLSDDALARFKRQMLRKDI